LPYGESIPTLPPIEESTIANKDVGIYIKSTPLRKDEAT